MPRRKRKRPNWPYRMAWLAIFGCLTLYIIGQTLRAAMTFGQRSYGTDWGLSIVAACLDTTFAVWFVAVGASIGSFLNVVAFRLPLGRSVGGHSGCFYCQTPIEGRDNVPVLAWIKLRGRCRRCRLPISIQYPLVELTLALIFLFVYVTEFSTSGLNLPGQKSAPQWGGLLRIATDSTSLLRITSYLLMLCGLVAAALIAVRRQVVPLKLYLWTLLPWLVAALVRPEVIVVRWRDVAPVGVIEARLDAFVTLVCGSVAAMAVARLLSPLLYPGFERSLIGSDRATHQARQWLGGFAIAGALVGWQAVVPLAWCIVLCSAVAMLLLRKFRYVAELRDLTVWLWLGLLVFRANWGWFDRLDLSVSLPPVMLHVAGALALAPVAWLIHRTAPETSKPQPFNPEPATAPSLAPLEAIESVAIDNTRPNVEI